MKIATAQTILRRLAKEAGVAVPVAIGAGLMAAGAGTKKAIDKSREYHAGFNPNYSPNGVQS